MHPAQSCGLPAVGHPRAAQLLLVVLFDTRAGAACEPDEARVESAVDALVGALRTLALERVVVTNLAGRVLDDGEVAAIVAAKAHKASLTTTLLFCDEDPVAHQNMGAAIESVGIDVARD